MSVSAAPSTASESASFVADRDYCFYTCSYDISWADRALSSTEDADTWFFDSSASRHITSRRDLFASVSAPPVEKSVQCANNASYPIRGIGEIQLTAIDGSSRCGLQVTFDDDRCMVRDKEHMTLVLIGTLCHGLYELDALSVDQSAYLTSTRTPAL